MTLAAFWVVSISLLSGVDAKVRERAHPARHVPRQGPSSHARQAPPVQAHQGPSDHEILLQLRDGQQALQRQILDLGQSLKEQVNIASESARDANERLEKQTAQGFQMLNGRISSIHTLLVLIFIALLAVLGGTLLIWRRLTMLEQSLATVQRRVSDLREQSGKPVPDF